jgi:ribosomal protein S18 acetylase RimI-like enzyme
VELVIGGSNTTVRIAVAADAPALNALAAATFALACPPGTTEDDIEAFVSSTLSVSRFAEYLADPARVLLVAEEAGELIGYTMLVFEEPADPDVAAAITIRPTAELSKCYVLAGHHGAGVAADLMAESIAVARRRGAAGLWLGVNQQNERANRFYSKHGFEVVGTKRFRVGAQLHDDFTRERVLGND